MCKDKTLTENDVVKIVSQYLKNKGYKILTTSKTTEKGIDLIAIHPEKGKCFVEAKGGTSSKEGTKRYGEPFSKNQIKDHIGSALLQTLKLKQENENSDVYIAVPFEKKHLQIFESIKKCLLQINIKVLFAKFDGSVEEI
jgi:Holliday junction resolvase-like predicted endonuclease